MGYSIRSGRYRYTVWVDWTDKIANTDNITAEELYDYEKDPLESVNVVKDPQYKDAYNLMRSYFSDFVRNRIN